MTHLASLNFSQTVSGNWTAGATSAGFANPTTNANSPKKSFSLNSNIANNLAGGADELFAEVVTIAASGNTTLSLSSFTDVVNQASIAFVRVKSWWFQLQSIADGAATAATSITVGNAASHPFLFNMGGTTPTTTIYTGGVWSYSDNTATGLTVTASTNDNIKIVNNDSVNAASVLVVICGGTT